MQIECELEVHFSKVLGKRIMLSICREALEPAELTPFERTRYAEMKHEHRKLSWLRGRKALRLICRKSGLDSLDPTEAVIQMPHPQLSLSHSGEFAIAAACNEKTGIGVDLELERPVKHGMSRFFLSERETNFVNSLEECEQNDNMLRLWTVKESLFKSDLNNSGKTVLKYELVDAALLTGLASTDTKCGESKLQFKYASKKLDKYWLSIAVPHGAKQ